MHRHVEARHCSKFRPGAGTGAIPRSTADAKLQTDKTSLKGRRKILGRGRGAYIAKYAFEEVLACFGDKPHPKNSILNSAEKVVSVITGKPTELVLPSNQERAVALEQFARKPYITVLAEGSSGGFLTRNNSRHGGSSPRCTTPPSATMPQVRRASAGIVEDCPRMWYDYLDKAVATNLINDDEFRHGEPRAELAEHRLISAWPRYREWIDGDRRSLSGGSDGRGDQDWARSRGSSEGLVNGSSLAEASQLASHCPED